MSTTILLVEDEKEIADTLAYALSTEGLEPTWVTNGQDALQKLNETPFSMAVFDVGLPDSNGFELLKSIRTAGEPYSDIPCLFLTARNEEIDRIIGLEIGADDYVCKPFSPREVVARIKAILKRNSAAPHNPNAPSKDNPFEHTPERRQIRYLDDVLDLTKAEYELMAIFLKNIGAVYTRRELINFVWSDKHPSDDRAIDTHVKTLRAKLKQHAPEQEFIVTHRGHGYGLEL